MDFGDGFATSDKSDLSSDKSDSESTQSTPEEERMRRLFLTCDTDGDGFITYDDIREVCSRLNFEFCVEEIMLHLGADVNGRVSYSEFVERRLQLLDINAAKSNHSDDDNSTVSEVKDPLMEVGSHSSSLDSFSNASTSINDEQVFANSRYNQSSAPCSSSGEDSNKMLWDPRKALHMESDSSGHDTKHDSWDFDSGMHELENENISLHSLIEASGIPLPSNINEMLDFTNRLHIDCLASLRQDLNETRNRLQIVLKERDFLQGQILLAKDEKIRAVKNLEKKRIRDVKKYEDGITELQSIIGEFSQKLDTYQYLTIKEEDECLEDDTFVTNCDADSSSAKFCKKTLQLNIKLETELKESRNELSKISIKDWVKDEKIEANEQRKSFIYAQEKQFDCEEASLQVDRLKCRISCLESQKDLLALHLEESQANAEGLTIILGKYEANNSALKLALNYSDQALEVYELLITLLESQIAMVLANCRAAGLGKLANQSEEEEKEEIAILYKRTAENRKIAENNAMQFLIKKCSQFDGAVGGKLAFSREDEYKLRDFLDSCKREKNLVRKSIVEIEPIDHHTETQRCVSDTNKRLNFNVDLENAVLLQDLMTIKEQNAELKIQLHQLECENSSLSKHIMELRSHSCDNKESDKHHNKEEANPSDKTLMNIDCKSSDYERIIEELKEDKSNLMIQLEKMKRKYMMKIKKLEHRNATNSQIYNTRVKMLQNKIAVLENDNGLRTSIETTL